MSKYVRSSCALCWMLQQELERDDGCISDALICGPWESSMFCAFRASLFKSGNHWKGRIGNNLSKASAASLVLILLVLYSSLHDYECKSTKPVACWISDGGWSVVCNLSVCDLPAVRGTGLTAAEGREKLVMSFKCSLACQMQGTAYFLLLLPSSETCNSHSICHPSCAVLLPEAVLRVDLKVYHLSGSKKWKCAPWDRTY